MGIAVLGPLAVDGNATGLAPRDRVVLAALAIGPGMAVSAEQLADALWPGRPPASWSKIVQGSVVRLRRVLGPHAIETLPRGYRLRVPPGEVDAHEFERLVGRGREQLVLDSPERASYTLAEALGLWRGRALVDLEGWEPGRIEARRLEEIRRDAEELRIEAALRVGRHREVLAEAQALSDAAPLRERRWELLALAQYQAGRQGDALRTLRQATKVLLDELGLDPGHDLVALEQAILRQDPSLDSGVADRATRADCPYLGLVAYDVEDAETFFGRDSDVTATMQRLARTGVVAVAGPSGSGKSSLVRAGLVAALRRDRSRVVVITPGPHPMDALGGLPASGSTAVLVVDQLEETVVLSHDPDEHAQFFAALAGHARTGRLVLAVRADRLGDLTVHAEFARLVERGLYLLNPMSEADLRRAVEGPARRAGLQLEPGLVELLIREVEGQPGALPLLSYALRQTWERREGSTLTVEGYRATGGIRHAVAQSAESLYEQLPAEERPALRDLLLRLVATGTKGDPVRVRVPRRQLASDSRHERLVELLVDARLVTSGDGDLELAHEAVARAWPRLRDWLEDDVEGQRIRRHLTAAADGWHGMGRPTSELYRGTRLAQVLDWREQARPDITPTEEAFIEAGRRLGDAEELSAAQQARAHARVNRRLRGLLSGVAFLLIAAVVAGTLAVRQADLAERTATTADARRIATQSQLADRIDQSLLLALAGLELERAPDTRASLLAALARSPQLTAFVPAVDMPFWHLDLSRDGRTIAVMDLGGRVQFFDGRSADHVGDFDPHPEGWAARMTCVCDPVTFSPDGAEVAVAVPTARRPVRLVDARSHRPVDHQLGGFPRSVMPIDIDYSADGRLLAATFDHFRDDPLEVVGSSAYVWDLRVPREPIRRIPLAGGPPFAELSPDGSALYTLPAASADVRSRARVFDVATGEQVRSLGVAGHPFALSADGSTIAYADGTAVVVIEAATGRELRRLHGPLVTQGDLEFSSDGDLLAAVSPDERTATVWRTGDGRVREVLHLGTGSFQDVRFSADNRRLFAAVERGLLVFDLAGDHRFVRRLTPPDAVRYAEGDTSRVPSPDGDLVAVTHRNRGSGSERVHLLDIATGRRIALAGVREFLAWRPDGRRVVGLGADGRLRVLSSRSGNLLVRSGYAFDGQVEYDDDGTRILATVDGGVAWLDATTLEPASGSVTLAGRNVTAAIPGPTDDSAVLFTGDEPRSIFDFTLTEGWALVGLDDGKVVRAGELSSSPDSMVMSPDGRRFAVAGGRGVEIVDLSTGESLVSADVGTEAGSEGVRLAYSRDGRLLVSADGTGRVSLWNGRTAVYLGTVNPGGEMSSPVFKQDGRTVLIPAWDGAVYEWDTSLDHAVEFACRIVGRGLSRAEWQAVAPNEPYRQTCTS